MSPDNIQKLPLFRDGSPAFMQALSAHAVTQSHPKGKILFLSGEEVSRFYYIQSGWVKLYKETLDGQQAIIDILPHSHFFGENVLFNNHTAMNSAEIIEEATITSFPLKDLQEEINQNNQVAMSILKLINQKNSAQSQEIEHRSLQNASQRIGCFILRLCPADQEENITIRLPYDKTLIAARLGMQPETFSRALSKLKQNTNITVHGASIHIQNIRRLSDFVCTACSSGFPCKDLCTNDHSAHK